MLLFKDKHLEKTSNNFIMTNGNGNIQQDIHSMQSESNMKIIAIAIVIAYD